MPVRYAHSSHRPPSTILRECVRPCVRRGRAYGGPAAGGRGGQTQVAVSQVSSCTRGISAQDAGPRRPRRGCVGGSGCWRAESRDHQIRALAPQLLAASTRAPAPGGPLTRCSPPALQDFAWRHSLSGQSGGPVAPPCADASQFKNTTDLRCNGLKADHRGDSSESAWTPAARILAALCTSGRILPMASMAAVAGSAPARGR